MPPGTHTGRREVSRAQVERVALGLFAEHGVEGVTVHQICAVAGIAPATFYRYFSTKNGVLFDYRPRFLEAIRAAVPDVPATGRSDQLKRALLAFAVFLDEHADALRTRDQIVARNPVLVPHTLQVQREWEEQLAITLARSRGVPDSDPQAWWDAALGLVVVRAAFRRWRSGGAPSLHRSVTVSFDEAVDALARQAPG
jgi:AcrR family transcriptional regulator